VSVLLLDASVWLAAVDRRDPHHAAAQALVRPGPCECELAALDLTVFEVANVAIKRWRSIERAYALIELVEIGAAGNLERVDGETAGVTIDLAAEHGLTAYDAAYLAIARRRGWTLVSCDFADLVDPGHAVGPSDIAMISV